MSSKFSLIVSMPDEGPVTHDLAGDALSLGRGPDNDIQVLVAEVSVKHGELKEEGPTFKLVDLGSTNGTTVNGVKVGPGGAQLSPMDKIVLGSTINAYFVPTAVLAATPAAELVASIEAAPKQAPAPGTAKVAIAAVAAPAAPGAPVARPAVALPVQPGEAGAATVRLDQVRPAPVPGPARPPGAPLAPPAPVSPGALRPPAGPPAPGGAPAGPPRPGAPAAPAAPPAPGGGPAAPRPIAPVPLKRPGAEGGAPSIPLPGPPKVKQD